MKNYAVLVSSPCWCGFPHWWDRPMVELDGTVDDHPVEPWLDPHDLAKAYAGYDENPRQADAYLDALDAAGLPIDNEFRRRFRERTGSVRRWLASMGYKA